MKIKKKTFDIYHSATVRLTGWYLFILMTVSVLFSVLIHQIATNELSVRLQRFQYSFQATTTSPIIIHSTDSDIFRKAELSSAADSLSANLLYLNLVVLVVGGISSYLFARRHLLPIKKSNEAQAQFTSDASHELRTPLAAMRTEIEATLLDKNASKEELREVLASSLEEINKINNLSDMLLRLAKTDATSLQLEKTDITNLVKHAASEFKEDKSRIHVDSKSYPSLFIDKSAIYELMKILIENAIKYSPPRSSIKIQVSKAALGCSIKISNAGSGIPQDSLKRVFERFYQVDSSRTDGKSKAGYGLGLSLAKRIVNLHKGKISAASIPNKKTTFTVFLPNNK